MSELEQDTRRAAAHAWADFDQISAAAMDDNPEVLAVAGTLRGLLAGVDVKTGILDAP
jgi:hypothetical protein